jgi:hypothetical protein
MTDMWGQAQFRAASSVPASVSCEALLGLTTKSHIHASTTGTRRDPPSSKRPEVVTLYTIAKIIAFPAKYASRNTNDGCKTDGNGTKVSA